ncbi:MAG: ABC transporter permease [Paramuribaculum sp.]|nr:ABC transporter permease [Paramuribaculum sp.]
MTSHTSTSAGAPVRHLLRRNISPAQLIGYAVANIVGLSIILTALMFYADATITPGGSAGTDPYLSSSFEVISKRVEGIGLTGAAMFTPAEIADIKAQPWAKRVGEFTPSQFTVNASVSLGGRGLSSYLFMESIPDDFFDIHPRDWDFDPTHPFIPVVLSKDYLALYNFGFATPQGLPQLSEGVISSVPVTFTITGVDGRPVTIPGGIVGFSSRLNTIAVPQSFMDWANSRFSPGAPAVQPGRLIVECDPLLSADMDRYLIDHDLDTSADRADEGTGRIARFTAIASGVVSIIGIVISAMAVGILFLSIWLILQKSRSRLYRLMLLGYSPRDVGQQLERLVALINLGVTVTAVAAMFAARSFWRPALADLDLGGASALQEIAVAAAFFLVVTGANIATIRRHLHRLWLHGA